MIDQAMARRDAPLTTIDQDADYTAAPKDRYARLDDKLSTSFGALLSYVGYSDAAIVYWVPQPKVRITSGSSIFDHRPDFQVIVEAEGPIRTRVPHVLYVEAKGAETQAFGKVRRGWPTSVPFPLAILKEGARAEVLFPEPLIEKEPSYA